MKKTQFIFTVVMAAVFSCWTTEGYDDLAKLLKAGVSEDVIIAFINSSNVRYALSPDTIVQLKAMGASDKVITAAIQRSGDIVTVNVPNARGGYTPVKLVKTANGYLGPQGEFYPNHPTVAQLKGLYGK